MFHSDVANSQPEGDAPRSSCQACVLNRELEAISAKSAVARVRSAGLEGRAGGPFHVNEGGHVEKSILRPIFCDSRDFRILRCNIVLSSGSQFRFAAV